MRGMKAGMPVQLEAAGGYCWRVLILRDMLGTTQLGRSYCLLAFRHEAEVHEA
jgi:hypothetical protein